MLNVQSKGLEKVAHYTMCKGKHKNSLFYGKDGLNGEIQLKDPAESNPESGIQTLDFGLEATISDKLLFFDFIFNEILCYRSNLLVDPKL